MQRHNSLLIAIVVALLTSACEQQAEVAEPAIPTINTSTTIPVADFRPSATLQEIMLSVIDPNIDPIWNAISTETSAEGEIEVRPETDEDWAQLRQHAIALREVANLLVIPGRKVAHPGTSTSIHHSELQADAIEALIAAQWPAFVQRAQALHDATNLALDAIDAKDVAKLEEVGGVIEHTCEGCHSQFWYPGDVRPVN